MSKEKVNSFQKACQVIIDTNKDLNQIFLQADNIIDYRLKDENFSRNELIEQLEYLAGPEFANVIIFCLEKRNLFANPAQMQEEIKNFELFTFLKYLVAKYSITYKKKFDKEYNKYGWKHIRHYVVNWNDQWNPNYLIEYHIELNNNSEIVIREDSNDILQLISCFVDGILEAEHGKFTVNQESVDNLLGKIIKLKKDEQ